MQKSMRLSLAAAMCLTIGCLTTGWATSRALAAAAAPSVSIEIAAEPGLPIDASQRWYRALTDLGISGLQIRSASTGDKPGITKQGASGYRVVGVLSADNVLVLPGGTFRVTDIGRLRQWLDKLRDGGAEGVTQQRSAFGLLPTQLQQVTDDLKRPVTAATQGMPASVAVGQIAATLGFPMLLDPQDRAALESVEIADELRGLSAGTALAILLRPAGLALAPERPAGGELQYQIHKAAGGSQAWPIGWKPAKRPIEVLPRLFEFLNVEITGIPVSEAVTAIQGRLEAPVFYDRNALALHGVDPAKVPAELPSKRISYSQTLGRVLAQAKLKFELRVDEAEKPFLWITTFKRSD
ncbi:MAG: hypothetical protein WD845_16300 [Pirellulales bacterium]